MFARVNQILSWKALRNTGLSRRFTSVSSKAVVDMAAKDGELRVFLVAGEVSGDTIGSRLMASLKRISPFTVKFSGVGGSMMSQHGLQSLYPMEELAVMGIWELLPHLYKIRLRLKETVEAALLFKPHVIVTVDAKGFSFRFLKEFRASYSQQHLDRPMHYHYVAPSFWAWKGGEARLKGLSHFIDHIFCILPFEEEVCRLNGLSATFVGHPVLEDCSELNLDTIDWKVQTNNHNFNFKFEIPPGAKFITLLPGSRLQEVKRMVPIFLKTLEILKETFSELSAFVLVASNRHVENYISSLNDCWPVPVKLIPGGATDLKYDAFSASTAALCTSGTVAVELQLARLPSVVAYRAHVLTEWLIRYKAKVPYISLPNILLDSPVMPEALFDRCTPRNLASTLMQLIQDDDYREQQINSADTIIRLLSPAVTNFIQLDLGETLQPSMIAAYTLLHHRRCQ
ncbi:probable lipid-A-disaccharide synthase, mitochondrial isoform X1 [Amaranthus tricolor]|uniref:probable lipid-A-disaccharide synthase, mitochondrial isoform X1 n=2 Tax=Amaranthus tricolor TaxID=29722 RepID=UPI0025890B42|nr:probable lipid-A-disaccharide synthase, mitochondrial isoform X1 [Amaranthus tricolor]XP_057527004.1 probable lipid-A-disaccharide synthase, mitochondrial isoform X1 [Amaranthus tricolor]